MKSKESASNIPKMYPKCGMKLRFIIGELGKLLDCTRYP